MKTAIAHQASRLYRTYSGIAFLSAFLLFLVQPMLSKFMLPWYGGSAMVWSASMLFFMFALLLGYIYAYSIAVLKIENQKKLHSFLLFSSAIIGITVILNWHEITNNPFLLEMVRDQPLLSLLLFLLFTVGLPFFALSSTTTLLQYWLGIQIEKSPYSLFAFSNTGSFAALLVYPFILEPTLSMTQHATLWIGLFLLYVILMLTVTKRIETNNLGTTNTKPQQADRIKTGNTATWLAMSTLPVIILLVVTNQITLALVPVPFLWILPLAAYLLSFVVTFNDAAIYSRKVAIGGLLVGSIITTWKTTLVLPAIGPEFYLTLFGYMLFLFSFCYLFHGELYKLRPTNHRQLPKFYVLISAGGTIGGILINIVMPNLFDDFWELLIAGYAGILISLFLIIYKKVSVKTVFRASNIVVAFSTIAFITLVIQTSTQSREMSARNFFGSFYVEDLVDDNQDKVRTFTHNLTKHGTQYLSGDANTSRIPLSYFSYESGIGRVFHHYRQEQADPLNVKIIGLGAGVLSAYCNKDDHFTFIEIDKDIIDTAQEYFTYIQDSPGQVSLLHGDGRKQIESFSKSAPHEADLIIIDAFSGDSIPHHLLTIEGFNIYLKTIKTEGAIAVHISNRYLDLSPVLQKNAEQLNLGIVQYSHTPDSTNSNEHIEASNWVILSENRAFLERLLSDNQAKTPTTKPGFRTWTDSYNSLLDVISW